ncbi:MAG: orotate phosphoribosyltransferase [Nitrospirales bacterium]|nr:orotate phosphoribosyltransferase [Nitrospirales bacterium]
MRDGLNPLQLKEQLAKAFCMLGAFQWDPKDGFRLASGQVSPYYVDCRSLLAYPDTRRLIAELAFHSMQALDIHAIGGLEIGAIPMSTAISDYAYQAIPQKEWRTFVVRKQPKGHGLGKLIEGAAQSGDQALILDDVLTSGGSLLKAVQAVREVGMLVSNALVIVDRGEQTGRQNVEAEGISVVGLLTLDDLKHMQRMLEARAIPKDRP